VNGGFTIKTLWRRGASVKLLAANPRYQPITFPEGTDLVIFGVVTWILHKAVG
jgi:DNA polymerase V